MKSEKGITLTSLVIYVIVATILIGIIAMISSFFFSNMDSVKDLEKYAPEFNKFSMFFIEDVKKNNSATVTSTKVTLKNTEAGTETVYEYKSSEQAIYRDSVKITENVESLTFTNSTTTISNTIKQIINVKMTIGGEQNAKNGIDYVLKYW